MKREGREDAGPNAEAFVALTTLNSQARKRNVSCRWPRAAKLVCHILWRVIAWLRRASRLPRISSPLASFPMHSIHGAVPERGLNDSLVSETRRLRIGIC